MKLLTTRSGPRLPGQPSCRHEAQRARRDPRRQRLHDADRRASDTTAIPPQRPATRRRRSARRRAPRGRARRAGSPPASDATRESRRAASAAIRRSPGSNRQPTSAPPFGKAAIASGNRQASTLRQQRAAATRRIDDRDLVGGRERDVEQAVVGVERQRARPGVAVAIVGRLPPSCVSMPSCRPATPAPRGEQRASDRRCDDDRRRSAPGITGGHLAPACGFASGSAAGPLAPESSSRSRPARARRAPAPRTRSRPAPAPPAPARPAARRRRPAPPRRRPPRPNQRGCSSAVAFDAVEIVDLPQDLTEPLDLGHQGGGQLGDRAPR